MDEGELYGNPLERRKVPREWGVKKKPWPTGGGNLVI